MALKAKITWMNINIDNKQVDVVLALYDECSVIQTNIESKQI